MLRISEQCLQDIKYSHNLFLQLFLSHTAVHINTVSPSKTPKPRQYIATALLNSKKLTAYRSINSIVIQTEP